MPDRTRPAALAAPALGWAAFCATALALGGGILLHARGLPTILLLTDLGTVALATLWRWRNTRPLPRWMRLALLLLVSGGVLVSLGNLFGREAGSALLAALLALKLLETHNRRDARVILTVNCFLALAGFLFDQGMLQSFATAVVCVLTLAALHSVNTQQTTQNQLLLDRNAVRHALGYFAASVPFAILCFVLFPRLGAPLWGAPQDAYAARTGISERMEPGALSNLALDDTPVLRVHFDGPLPAPGQRYFRGPVLWRFDGSAWDGADAWRGYDKPAPVRPLAPEITYQVTQEATDQRWLFLLDVPLQAPEGSQLTADLQVRATQPVTEVRRYRGRSVPRYVLQPELTAYQHSLALQLPDAANPRAIALAQGWKQQLGSDSPAIAQAALQMFRQGFSYSFEVPRLDPSHPLDDFLFQTRSGWCEHYASSFTFLMRAAGIPARVVTGFQGGFYNASGGYLTVRRSDAHAWSEIWIAGQGWVRVDPTSAIAPERIFNDARSASETTGAWYASGWLNRWKDQVDLVSYWWTQRVVQFSAMRQRQLLRDFGLDAPSPQLSIALLVAGATLGLLPALWLLVAHRTRKDPLLAQWRAFCADLERLGVRRLPHEGPENFTRRAALELPRHATWIQRIGQCFIRLRYAGPGDAIDASQVRSFKQQVRAARRFLRADRLT